MKIKTKVLSYDKVMELKPDKPFKPKKPNILFRTLLCVLSIFDLIATRFKCNKIGMEKLGKKEPCLILMNHSSFIDLKIASVILYPRPFNIVCTSDGFVGKRWLMRQLGCIPTNKFVADPKLIRNLSNSFKKLSCSVLMYPEASYSFDGTATDLPSSLGRLIKLLGVPVVMIKTYGAFQRDPLYNNLQLRKVNVSADMIYLLSPEDIKAKSSEDINDILDEQFSFDNFRWQQENNIIVDEKFRADYLNRALYKCPHCLDETSMEGKGTTITCKKCGASYELTETGFLKALNCEEKFNHIPDWYNWERECVKQEIVDGTYNLELAVDIYMLVNTKAVYKVGDGRLVHSTNGFHLTGCDGKIDFTHSPNASYSLYSDYYWYEIGDVICIGDSKTLYYCFPKTNDDIVAKARLATEEMYKLTKSKKESLA